MLKATLLCAMLITVVSWPISAKPKPLSAKRVAVVLDVSDKVTNHHVGVTAFGNFEQKLDNDWALPEFVGRHIAQRLAESGIDYVLVPVDKSSLEALVGTTCFSGWSGKFTPACALRLRQWLDEQQVDAMLHVESGEGQAGALGPPRFSDVGLFTRGTKRPDIIFPVALIWLHLYSTDISGQPPYSNPYACGIGKRINPGPWAKDVDIQTINDLAWLRPLLEAQIVSVLDDGLFKLGLVASGTEVCSR